jgi:hypothetical protein
MIGVLVAGLLVGGTLNNDTPPVKFQKNAVALVVTVDDTNKACGTAPKGWRYIGCEFVKDGQPTILLPNPCQYDTEFYAHLLCHELGHANGWNATHDN